MRAKIAAETHGNINVTPHMRAQDGTLRPVPESRPCEQCAACIGNEADSGVTVPCEHPVNLRKGPHAVKADRWRARTWAMLPDGKRRLVERWGITKAAATAAVKAAVRERMEEVKAPDRVRSVKTVADVAAEWVESIREDARLAPRSRELYAGTVQRHVLGTPLAAMLPRSVKAGDVEDHLNEIARTVGAGTAKTTRSVLSKVLGRAARYGLAERNVVRDADPTIVPDGAKVTAKVTVKGSDGKVTVTEVERDHDRALTAEQVAGLLWFAYRDPAARAPEWAHRTVTDPTGRDTADLIALMLATGVRAGEALAVTVGSVDLGHGLLNISGTITRVTGKGLVRGDTKTADSTRTIPLPRRTVAMLRRRIGTDTGPDAPVFASTRGTFRDPSNTNREIRDVLDRFGLTWATPHSFRRTVLSRLGDLGVPLRLVADLAGHTNPAMTARRYLGRRGANEILRAAL